MRKPGQQVTGLREWRFRMWPGSLQGLASPKCPANIKREFQDAPGRVFEVLVEINSPELVGYLNHLRQLFSETHPDMPVLMRASRARGRPINVEMQHFEDLLVLIRDAPIGNPYRPDDE
jgi:hypothetical protein